MRPPAPRPSDAHRPPRTAEEARRWIRAVGGQVLRNPERDPAGEGWVALVRTPAPPGRRGKLIVAFGPTFVDATAAAERSFTEHLETAGSVH